MKKICIALDYTPFAVKVANTGYTLSESLGAHVALVHVITEQAYYAVDNNPDLDYESLSEESGKEYYEAIEQGAVNFLSAIADQLHNENVKKVVLEGSTADSILEYVAENHVDLLVMGTHGHSGLEQLLMGNTAGRVVRYSPIPILLVPTNK